MKIKDIIELENKISNIESFLEILGGDSNGTVNQYQKAKDSLEQNALQAKSVLLAKMTEKDLVEAMFAVQSIVVAAIAANGDESLIEAQIKGTLQPYTHTLILTFLGILMEEEVI